MPRNVCKSLEGLGVIESPARVKQRWIGLTQVYFAKIELNMKLLKSIRLMMKPICEPVLESADGPVVHVADCYHFPYL